jgi:hypothetical protein
MTADTSGAMSAMQSRKRNAGYGHFRDWTAFVGSTRLLRKGMSNGKKTGIVGVKPTSAVYIRASWLQPRSDRAHVILSTVQLAEFEHST